MRRRVVGNLPFEINLEDHSEKIVQECLEYLKKYIDEHKEINLDRFIVVFNIDHFLSDFDIDDILSFEHRGYNVVPQNVSKGGKITLVLRKVLNDL